jgi:hypothetical protein
VSLDASRGLGHCWAQGQVGFGHLSADHGAGHGFGLRCGPGDAQARSAFVVLALGASGLKAEKSDGKEMALGDGGNNIFVCFSHSS